MERNASFDKVLTPEPRPAAKRTVARPFGSFMLRCLKAMARGYVQSCAYNPYWIGAGRLHGARTGQASSR